MPLPSGYDKEKDFYPSYEHVDYRWAMTVDLDRCIGCRRVVVACYAENNIGGSWERECPEGDVKCPGST